MENVLQGNSALLPHLPAHFAQEESTKQLLEDLVSRVLLEDLAQRKEQKPMPAMPSALQVVNVL